MSENPTPPAGDQPPYGAPQQPQYGAPQQPYGSAPQQPWSAPAGGAPVSDADRKLWAMLAHLGGILFGFIPSLVVWLIYKDRDEFIKDQSQEALNFQITMVIAWVVASALTAVLIGLIFYPVIFIANLVLCIMAGLAANRGERYRYPFALRLIK